MNNKADATNMKSEKKRELVPNLRFPEFRGAPAWDEKRLGNIASFFKGKGLSKSAITPDGESPCIHYGELFTEYSEVIEIVKSYTNSKDSVFLSIKNDVLMPTSDVTPSGLAKACCINLDDVILGGDILVIRSSKQEINGEFLARYIRLLEQKVLQLVSGTTIFHLYATSIDKLALSFPSLPEQQKIAGCLSSLDDLIAIQTKKLDTLNAHKKGLLQQLFPAEGETLPMLRFPEFQAAREWENEQLGNVYTFKATNSFSRSKLNYENGSVRNIHYGDVHTKFSTLFNIEKEVVPFINPSESLENIDLASYCLEGDMVFADASEDLEDVGKSIEIIHLNNEQLLAGLHTILARQKEKKLIVGFGGYLFRSNRIRVQIRKEAQGAKVLGISAGRISNIEICFPSDKKEQQKITDCLSSLDELIDAHNRKLDTLKTHKRGLMQQLFPSPEEAHA